MRILSLALVAALLTACGGYVAPLPELTRIENSRVIRGVEFVNSEAAWRATGYWRQGDPMSGPYFVAIGADGSACLVSNDVWAVARRGDRISCNTAWRSRRP
jgi:hypothetical protein